MKGSSDFSIDSLERMVLEHVARCGALDMLAPLTRSVAESLSRRGLLALRGAVYHLTETGRSVLNLPTSVAA